jgi:hypothetical protein
MQYSFMMDLLSTCICNVLWGIPISILPTTPKYRPPNSPSLTFVNYIADTRLILTLCQVMKVLVKMWNALFFHDRSFLNVHM